MERQTTGLAPGASQVTPFPAPRLFGMITLAVIAVCGLMMMTIDRPLALAVHSDLSPALKAFFRDITDLGLAGPFIIAGVVLYLVGRALFLMAVPQRMAQFYWRLSTMALYLLATMAVSGAVVHILKFSVGRLRPKHLIREGTYGFDPGLSEFANNSFPSGHSQTIFSVMMVLTLLFPRFWMVFLVPAAVIAFSRVMVSAHYPSDVVMGSFIAILSAIVVKKRWFDDLDGHAVFAPGANHGARS